MQKSTVKTNILPTRTPLALAWFAVGVCGGFLVSLLPLVLQSDQLPLIASFSLVTILLMARSLRRYQLIMQTMREALKHWYHTQHLGDSQSVSPRSFASGLQQMKHVLESAIHNHRQLAELRMQLLAYQHWATQLSGTQEMHREMRKLCEHLHIFSAEMDSLTSPQCISDLTRDRFDALLEHSFNIQLQLRAVEMLSARASCLHVAELINPTQTLSRILVPLAAALDRRTMKLSSAAWSERTNVRIPQETLELVCWLVLLGTVRYAEDESELTLSCEPATDGSATFITCLVSELAPASMHASERAAFMQQKEKHTSAHMFAHTLQHAPNLSLAAHLLARAGGELMIHPHTPTRCLIEMRLPC